MEIVYFMDYVSKPEWLKVCLDKICPNKNGINIADDEVLKAIQNYVLTEEAQTLLIEYGIHFDDLKNMPTIKKIFKSTESITILSFILNGLSPESKKSLLNSQEYGEDFMIQAIQGDNFEKFKLFLEHGADPLQKSRYGDYELLSKPEWLKFCLDKICPNKDGTNIPVQELISTEEFGDSNKDSLLLLLEYGMGVGNPEAAAILEQAIKAKQKQS